MKALKILGIVFGILLLLTGGGLAVGSVAASKGQTALDQQLASHRRSATSSRRTTTRATRARSWWSTCPGLAI